MVIFQFLSHNYSNDIRTFLLVKNYAFRRNSASFPATLTIKSERVNVLRKQYDAFLEEDKKRQERNKYILNRLDKISGCNALVPLRNKPSPDVYAAAPNTVYHERPALRRDHVYDLFPSRSSQQEIHHNSTTTLIDETLLLKQISKKYILIPRLRPRYENNIEELPKHAVDDNTDWKRKYEILEQLKRDEKEPSDSQIIKEQTTHLKDKEPYYNKDKYTQKIPDNYRNETPERDIKYGLQERATTSMTNYENGKDLSYYDTKPNIRQVESNFGNLQLDKNNLNLKPDVQIKEPVTKISTKFDNNEGPPVDENTTHNIEYTQSAEYEPYNDYTPRGRTDENTVTFLNPDGEAPTQILAPESVKASLKISEPVTNGLLTENYESSSAFVKNHNVSPVLVSDMEHAVSVENTSAEKEGFVEFSVPGVLAVEENNVDPYNFGIEAQNEAYVASSETVNSNYQYDPNAEDIEKVAEYKYADQAENAQNVSTYNELQTVAQEQYEETEQYPEQTENLQQQSHDVQESQENPMYQEGENLTNILSSAAEVVDPVFENSPQTYAEESGAAEEAYEQEPQYEAQTFDSNNADQSGYQATTEYNLQPVEGDAGQQNVDPQYQYEGAVDSAGVEEFEAEQREMFYTEQPAENYENFNEEGYNTVPANEEYQQDYMYYEEQANPVEINEHEETAHQYDPSFEQQYGQQYAEQYDNTQQQEYEQGDQVQQGYEPSNEQYDQVQYQQNIESQENIEHKLDQEQGLVQPGAGDYQQVPPSAAAPEPSPAKGQDKKK